MSPHALAQVYLILRLALGLIFIVSACTKLRDLRAFVQGVLDYRVLPRPVARCYGWSLPFVELGTALLLLSGFFVTVGTVLAVLMLTSFAVAIAVNAIRGHTPACHCFGTSPTSRVGWHTLIRDLILLLPAGWLAWAGIATEASNAIGRALLVPGLGIAAIAALAYALIMERLEMSTQRTPGDWARRHT